MLMAIFYIIGAVTVAIGICLFGLITQAAKDMEALERFWENEE